MKKLTSIITALLLVIGMAQCKKNINPVTPEGGEGKNVTLNVSIGNGSKTEIDKSGKTKWSVGDKLYVFGEVDGYLGFVTTSEDFTEPAQTATFNGTITPISATQNLHFYYLGTQELELAGTTTYSYNTESQTGELEDIADKMHLMHGELVDIAPEISDFGDITMTNLMSIALFDISGYGNPAKCEGAVTSRTLNLMTGEWNDDAQTGTVTLNTPCDGYFMVLIPSDDEQTLTFSNADGSCDKEFSRRIDADKIYSNGGKPIVVYTEWVDLNNPELGIIGLPRWASKNLGATSEIDTGYYYAWGELRGHGQKMDSYGDWSGEKNPNYINGIIKLDYKLNYYKWGKLGDIYFKYNDTDGKTTLEYCDDAAYQLLGGKGRIPTQNDWKNLKESTLMIRTDNYKSLGLYGVVVYKVKDSSDIGYHAASNGTIGNYTINSRTYNVYEDEHIFLPFAGYYNGEAPTPSVGFYASASIGNNMAFVYVAELKYAYLNYTQVRRYQGYPIRPVKVE